MTFEVKVVMAPLPREENEKRIARLARWLLWACDYLESKKKASRCQGIQAEVDASWEIDDLDLALMPPTSDQKSARRK